MYCNKCGRQVSSTDKFCPECGKKLESGMNQYNSYRSNNGFKASSCSNPNDESSFGYSLLSFFMPYVGLVLYIVWLKDYPKRAKSCLNGIIAGVICVVILICCVYSGMAGSNYRQLISSEKSTINEISIQND